MKIVLMICVASVLLSCKKDLDYTINGTLKDLSFNSNLLGAEVKLLGYKPNAFVPVELGKQNPSDGKYSFTFKRDSYDYFEIITTKNNYFSDTKKILFKDLSTKTDYEFNPSLYARSWVKFVFSSPNPSLLRFLKQTGKSNCSECCNSEYVFFQGPGTYTSYCINDGNTPFQIYYNIMGTPIQGPVSVTTVPFDTTEMVLEF